MNEAHFVVNATTQPLVVDMNQAYQTSHAVAKIVRPLPSSDILRAVFLTNKTPNLESVVHV